METITLVQYLTALQGALRAIISLCALVLILLCTNRQSHIPAFKYFLYFIVAMGLWGFFGSVFYIYPNDEILPYVSPLIYAAISFGGPAFMRFCFSYVFPHKKNLIKFLRWIYIFPCIFSLSVLLPQLQKYSIIFSNEVIYIPYRDILEQYHFLYYVYIFYSYATVVLGSAVLLYKVIKQPQEATTGNKLAIVAALLFIGQNMFVTFNEYTNRFFWVPPITVNLCMVLLFFTLYYDTSEQIIIQGQSALLKTIPFPVFILNKNDIIVHFNKKGKEFFTSRRNKGVYFFKKNDLLRQFTTFEIEMPLEGDQYRGTNKFIQKNDDKTLFFLQEQEISDEEHVKNQGHVIMLVPLTSIQNFFTTLEFKAFRDSLCQCYNRHFLELKQNEPASPDSFPISLLVCDLDNLKTINDVLGHARGDEYILSCYNAICSQIKKESLVFRLGGDEFLVILYKTPATTAQTIAKNIESKVAQNQNFLPHKIGISIGCSTATSNTTNFEDCFKKADEEMYKTKAKHKGKQ